MFWTNLVPGMTYRREKQRDEVRYQQLRVGVCRTGGLRRSDSDSHSDPIVRPSVGSMTVYEDAAASLGLHAHWGVSRAKRSDISSINSVRSSK